MVEITPPKPISQPVPIRSTPFPHRVDDSRHSNVTTVVKNQSHAKDGEPPSSYKCTVPPSRTSTPCNHDLFFCFSKQTIHSRSKNNGAMSTGVWIIASGACSDSQQAAQSGFCRVRWDWTASYCPAESKKDDDDDDDDDTLESYQQHLMCVVTVCSDGSITAVIRNANGLLQCEPFLQTFRSTMETKLTRQVAKHLHQGATRSRLRVGQNPQALLVPAA